MLERINLVPQKPIADKIKKITVPLVGLISALILLFLSGNYYFLESKLTDTERELTDLQTKMDNTTRLQVQKKILTEEVTALEKQHADIKKQVSTLTTHSSKQRGYTNVLTKIAQIMPSSIKFNQISFIDNSGEITGTALQYKDLPGFVDTLKKDPLFKNAQLQDIDRGLKNNQQRLSYRVLFELK